MSNQKKFDFELTLLPFPPEWNTKTKNILRLQGTYKNRSWSLTNMWVKADDAMIDILPLNGVFTEGLFGVGVISNVIVSAIKAHIKYLKSHEHSNDN